MRRFKTKTARARAPRRAPARTAVSTITQVAERAGVSIATVSRARADPSAVSEELRNRVYEAARVLSCGTRLRLPCHPNPASGVITTL
jgi:hypothetical protein